MKIQFMQLYCKFIHFLKILYSEGSGSKAEHCNLIGGRYKII